MTDYFSYSPSQLKEYEAERTKRDRRDLDVIFGIFAAIPQAQHSHATKNYESYYQKAFWPTDYFGQKINAAELKSGVNFTNQTLSYTLKNGAANALFAKIAHLITPTTTFVDATAGIGGHSIKFSVKFRRPIVAFEPDSRRFAMLSANVIKYKVPAKICNCKFTTANLPAGHKIFIIDPPFEETNDNFVFSIERRPIHEIVDDIFAAWPDSIVILDGPDNTYGNEFKYWDAAAAKRKIDIIRTNKLKFYVIRN